MDAATPGIGFGHFLAQADGVAKFILVLMAVASAASWYLIVTKLVSYARAKRRSSAFLDFFWNAPSLDVVAAQIEQKHPDEPFSHLVYHAIVASRHHERHGINRLNEAGSSSDFVTRTLRKTIDEETASLESGLTVLASVGSTAPFVGLLGTVWGIYHALTAIGIAGQASIDKVAGPVGEALIMTAIGLAVAVPAVLGYNWLVRRNKSALEQVRNFGSELHAVLLGAQATRPVEVPSQRRREQRATAAAA